MDVLATFVMWLHLLAAVTWVGGMIFVNVVLTPAVQPKGIPPGFVRIMGIERFRGFAWASIGLLAVTGIFNTAISMPNPASLTITPYGITMALKIGVYLVMIAITAENSLRLVPKIKSLSGPPTGGPPPEAMTIQKRLVILSRINLALGLTVLFLAVLLRIMPRW